MKKPKRYPSVNAMLRGTMPTAKANELIDRMQQTVVRQNAELLGQLTRLVEACTADSPSGVRCPDRRVVRAARRLAKEHGAVFAKG